MELQTISQVSKQFSISTRTLRYYEQIGLIAPVKKEDFAYRVYDMEGITRLRQIIILRKLRLPLKQIAEILKNEDARIAIEAFESNLLEIEDEITSLSTIRSVVKTFIEYLSYENTKFALPDDEGLLEIVDSLTISKINFKEEKSMDQLNNANENLNKLEDKDVRIIYLPPMTIAAAFASGEDCEGKAGGMIAQFVNESGLLKIKPDIRSFGFDCSVKSTGIEEAPRGYEIWVSIPEDMEVPEPFVKRTFDGGLYAAHLLRTWDFADRGHLEKWVADSDKYDSDWSSPRWILPESVVTQNFEETLNYYNFVQNGIMENMQLDILVPIKEKMDERG